MKVCLLNENKWNIHFVYSPLFELLCSVHVLANPVHHLERITWAEEMKSRIPGDLYNDLLEFSKSTCEWCAIMDFCNIYEECDDFNINAALDFIDDLSIEKFNSVFSKYQNYRIKFFNQISKKKMIRTLKEYYLSYFEKELRFIEPLLIRNLRKASEKCRSEGILKYVNELHNRIEITQEAFLFHKYTLFTVPYNSIETIIIRISSFINPHLLMDYGESMVQFTESVHLDKEIDKVPLDLLRVMKALSDETRMKIIKSLNRNKCSTQSLAFELKLTEACISKHLKLLYEAGLLYKERAGSFMYYYLNTELIDRIPLGIHEYLG